MDQATDAPSPADADVPDPLGGVAELDQYADRLTRELMRIRRLLGPGLHPHRAGSADGLPRLERGGYAVLALLVTDGPHRVKDLAEATRADQSGVSRAVSALVCRGLAERRADPDDGRAIRLVATDHGREVFARARARRRSVLSAATASWSAEDVGVLVDLLERLTTDLTAAVRTDEGPRA